MSLRLPKDHPSLRQPLPLPKSKTAEDVTSGPPALPPRPPKPRHMSLSEGAHHRQVPHPILPPQDVEKTDLREALLAPKPSVEAMTFLKENPDVDLPPTRDVYYFTSISPQMSVQSFLSTEKCPKLVRIKTNYHSPIGILTLAENQIIVAMGIKMAVVVSGVDSSGSLFKLPEGCKEIKFAPFQDSSPATFTVQDLFKMKHLPSVFVPTKSFIDVKGTKVQQNTLLFSVKKHKFTPTPSSTIKVSTAEGDVYIDSGIRCSFSSKREDVKMSLQTLIKRMPLPVKVEPFSSDDDIDTIEELTLKRVDTERILTGIVRVSSSTRMPIIDIPSSLSIMLEIITPERESHLENIYSTAETQYANFLPKYRKECMWSNPSDDIPTRTTKPYTEDNGPKPSVFETLADRYEFEVTSSDEHDYESVEASRYSIPRQLHLVNKSDERHIPPELPITQHHAPVEQSQSNSDFATDQKAYLQSLSIESIQTLLQAMNLSCYCESFKTEQIDGELLSSLNSEMLRELGVTKSIHLLRLQKVINGTHSAKEIIDRHNESN